MRDPVSPGRTGKLRSVPTEERRRSERHPFSEVADVTEPLSNAGISVRISDLGLHGCYADSLTVFPINSTVKICIHHSGRDLETLAKVVYAKTGMGMGLCFQDLTAEKELLLREWLPASKGESKLPVESSSVTDRTVEIEPFEVQPRKEKPALTRLIELMMHKGQLSELEGRELLKQLQRER